MAGTERLRRWWRIPRRNNRVESNRGVLVPGPTGWFFLREKLSPNSYSPRGTTFEKLFFHWKNGGFFEANNVFVTFL
jgi:hypothetical protein